MRRTGERIARGLRASIKRQRDRRNLTDAELLKCIEVVDKRKRQGERTDLAPPDAKLETGKSSEDTASLLGISPRKVERARTVIDHATPETKAGVEM